MSLSFDALAAQFDDQRGLPATALRHLVAFINEISQGKSLTIIEPGVGTGRIALPLAAAGHQVVGVDISRAMLDACLEKAEALNVLDRVTLIEDDATNQVSPDDMFDIGIFASLLYLVPDWEAVLDELARVVKPGGAVIWVRERTEQSDALTLWDIGWRTRVESAGYAHQSSTPTEVDILNAMQRRWPDLVIEPLASWTFGQAVWEGRADYSSRLRALYPDIPDVDWERLVRDFLRWVEMAFPDPEQRLDGRVVLETVVAWT